MLLWFKLIYLDIILLVTQLLRNSSLYLYTYFCQLVSTNMTIYMYKFYSILKIIFCLLIAVLIVISME